MRALVLDDDKIFLTVCESYLSMLGASSIQSTTDTVEASDIIFNDGIDLVMLDLNMPEKDGFSFLRSLSESNYEGAIIIVSGENASVISSSGYVGEKLGLNICGTLSKPLQLPELKRAYETAKASAVRHIVRDGPIVTEPYGVLQPTLYYQPQIDSDTGVLVGAEALLRGIDGRGNVFGPYELLDEFNEPQERFALTKRLFQILCRDVAQLQKKGFTNRFSFNVDAGTIEHADFFNMLLETTQQHGVSPKGIVIELTESHLPKNESWLLEVIARINMAGFEASMDDFSTGAASFDLLRAGAFSEFKLDSTVVMRSAHDGASAKFITNAYELSHTLDIRIVAEGVETAVDLDRMSKMGLSIMQGFYLARPAPKEQLSKLYQIDSALLKDVC